MSCAARSRKRVAVVGAGVVGLNAALEIQRRLPGCDVTVIADKFNGETLSDGAAGLFRPDTYIFGPDVQTSRKWVKDSYSFYKNLLDKKDVDGPYGINSVSGYAFTSKDPSFIMNHYMEHCAPNYRDATEEELSMHSETKSKIINGIFCTSIVIECKRFLPWALKMITDNGGTIVKRKIESLEELCKDYDIVFNCTGYAAKKLCKDYNMTPIRGQVIRVKAPWVDKFYYYDGDTYIIPSKEDGTVVLGGCRHFGSNNETANDRNTEEILENCVRLVPSLREALKTDYSVWVGLRPYRNQIRIEIETINGTAIVHNYGHGGYGVTLAPGTSKHAVDLLISYLQTEAASTSE
ncbi:D-amino-acid oxidase,FAD dependent oxidoreductase,FAD/NAD(P)-binding domain [Cinara cedri]|uniref:D-amino-acid oxidase,FAD dependent oxidoreductase,FAD/NAD(P)-binding domain n=1 Tax=Cinara cedri TaxID=506608 RepID=A0A5E4MVR7_9HEMI|nr:D-amino-acid oxidase,FAD dependent oxidoreductase,FAD/NAD(P)-binding domain [Cinara cedri]